MLVQNGPDSPSILLRDHRRSKHAQHAGHNDQRRRWQFVVKEIQDITNYVARNQAPGSSNPISPRSTHLMSSSHGLNIAIQHRACSAQRHGRQRLQRSALASLQPIGLWQSWASYRLGDQALRDGMFCDEPLSMDSKARSTRLFLGGLSHATSGTRTVVVGKAFQQSSGDA
ncbi:hypothetical protein M436DRAFT_64510 [Aureobasidium namibiae CBS 147.97]|uniref:Uncharacterized protein n=1 Tax=Aureobasidium namibiae CBS 147.97 TaxID=1043004 RepID=A0A074WHD7_9PEZI|nr:uncharacterized protein M436DRAFT_64510 [Aureobasidium namibiae CBS 147.97]KEQ72510.1 hypothetical protein M436DRAFT_64510 [Aureobasidium namibiae CBS 147.97]